MLALCLDFGNTLCKAALVQDGIVQEIFILDKEKPFLAIQKIVQTHQPTHSIWVSVLAKEEVELKQFLITHTTFVELQASTALPFANLYQSPNSLGLDRLALVAAAHHLYPNQHSLVVALGTCITYNFINNNNQFIGGSISLGVQMRYAALHHFTQKLPLVQNENLIPLVGTTTNTSLQSGVVNGIVAELDGIIAAYKDDYPKINVILTGGNMPQFEMQLKSKIFADANFLFKGLYAILQHNS